MTGSWLLVTGGFLLATSYQPLATVFAAGELDGQTYVGQWGKQGATKGEPVELIFEGGAMRSTAGDRHGFGPVAYRTLPGADAVIFEATATSPTAGTQVWVGTIQREQLEASVIWSRRGRPPAEYWLYGVLKKSSTDEEGSP